MEQVIAFINDPMVAPLYGLLVTALLGMALGVYRSVQQGTFDLKKLPGVLDSTILQKIIPLAALGAASFFVAPGAPKDALTVAYLTGCATAYAGEIAALIDKAKGTFIATTVAQDKGVAPLPAPPDA